MLDARKNLIQDKTKENTNISIVRADA